MRKTKIVCTMGPATDNPEILRDLMLAGMNVGSSIIYILVLLSAIWLIIVAISNKWYINLCTKNEHR